MALPSRILRILFIRILPVIFVLCAPVSAQGQRLWPEVVDTVRVTAPRPTVREELARGSGFSTYVPLGASASSSRELSDLLDRTAGVHVHRYGGLGAFSMATVRGSSAGQVLICIDGVPVSSAGEGLVSLSLFPLSSLEHAEIYRGPQTVAFAGPAAAGVINLVTPPVQPVPLRLSGGVGSFGTATVRGQWGARHGVLSGLLSGQYRRSRGDFQYRNRNGTYYQNTADDTVVRRANNDFHDLALLFKASANVFPSDPPRQRQANGSEDAGNVERAGEDVRTAATPGLRLEYTLQRMTRKSGIPGTESVQTREVRFDTGRTRHELAATGRPLYRGAATEGWRDVLSSLLLQGSIHTERIDDRYENRSGEVGLGRTATQNRTLSRGARATGTLLVPSLRQRLRSSIEGREERFTPTDLLRDRTEFTRTRRHRTVLLEDRLLAGRLTLEGNYRWARAQDNYGGPILWGQPATAAPRREFHQQAAAFGARFDLGAGLALKANRGRITRFPSFPELFGQNGIQDGNPTLKPERGIHWDAGLVFAPEQPLAMRPLPLSLPLRLESVYFESLVEDRISLLQNSQRTTKAQNLDRTWARGVESSLWTRALLPLGSSLELQGDFTWQEARDRGRSRTYRGKDLPNLPRREGYVSSRLERGGWSLRWEASSRSPAYRDRFNSSEKRTPAYTVHDLSLTRTLRDGAWKVQGEVRNLKDARVQDMDGFPLPGRSYLMEVTWTR